MGKGYKRKTRWRTLNIGAPSGKEDEEKNETSREHREESYEEHHRPHHRKNNTTNTNGVGSSDSTRTSPPRFQQKVVFNENEYTKITTPRQDMLFKKGYLAKKMVYSSNNPSTSATPSTTDSQSASHSTADGSEITEDQQLFDYRDNGLTEYQPMNGLVPEMVYGTFYDPVGGYYYEYPVMVGPMYPDAGMQNVMPCEPVPVGPVQWVDPSYVSEIDQPYYVMDYENPQITHQVLAEENSIVPPMTTCTDCTEINGEIDDEKCNCSVIDKEQKDPEQQDQSNWEVPYDSEVTDQPIVSSDVGLETAFSQQLQISHQGVPPQSHMYPGHYMFINVNGMPISSNLMRGTEMNSGANIYPKRRNKKRMKTKRVIRQIYQDNNGDCEYFNSEIDSVETTTESFTPKSQPLNPYCEEFKLKTTTPTTPPTPTTPTPETNIDDTKDIKNNDDDDDDEINEEELIINSSSESTIPDVEYAIEAISTERLSEPEEPEIGVDVTCTEINDNFTNDKYDNTISMNVPNNETNECGKLLNGNSIEPNLPLDIHENIDNCYSKNSTVPKIHMIPNKKYKNHKIINNEIMIPNDDNDNVIETDVTNINNDIEVMLGVEAIELQVSDKIVSSTEISSVTNNNYNAANNDSNFEYRINISDHPITDAVTQWLRRANSPELFVGLKMGTVNTDDDDDDDDDNDDDNDDEVNNTKPSKNLQGNPMLALSFNNIRNNKNIKFTINMSNKNDKNIIKTFNDTFFYQNVSHNNYNNNCKFNNKKDSVASMRVAENTRFNFINKINDNGYKNQSIKFNSNNKNLITQITNN